MVPAMGAWLLLLLLSSPAAEPVPATFAEPPESESRASESEVSTGDPWNIQLGIGLGQQYAGIGAGVSAYARVAQVWSLGAFASVGLSDVETCCSQWGYAAGALAAWGWQDRVALALSYGAVWSEGDTIDYGITVAAGYELLSRQGFWLRWLVGVAVVTDTERDAIPTINLGLGWNL
jgi:hypothetical protein